MAVAGASVHESINVTGRAASEVAAMVAETLGRHGDCQAVQVAPGTSQYVRTYRPTWALVLGVLGILFLGLGVLFFFVRKTETCTITVVDGPTGALVTLSGRLRRARLEAVRATIAGDAPPPQAPAVQLPPVPPLQLRTVQAAPVHSLPVQLPPEPIVLSEGTPPAVVVETPWTGRIDLSPGGAIVPAQSGVETTIAVQRRSTPTQPERRRYALRFDDGAVASVLSTLIVGRDPAATDHSHASSTQLFAVSDQPLSVSKTHFLVREHDGVLWVEDLHSTNGTVVVRPNGERCPAEPGRPVVAEPGSVVVFGDRRAEVAIDD